MYQSLEETKVMVRLLDLVLVVVVVNYLNTKETIRLPKVSIAKRQKIDNKKVVDIVVMVISYLTIGYNWII